MFPRDVAFYVFPRRRLGRSDAPEHINGMRVIAKRTMGNAMRIPISPEQANG